MGFFFPGRGCTPEKMFGPIKSIDPNAKLPCWHHHALTFKCTKPECTYLHGSFIRFDPNYRTSILNGMMEHKTARLNRKLKNNKRFKACVDEKYNELWSELPASNSTNEGA
jgi:hypothetical protein